MPRMPIAKKYQSTFPPCRCSTLRTRSSGPCSCSALCIASNGSRSAGPFRCRYHDAGHLLGSAMVDMEVAGQATTPTKILFSGDVGRYNARSITTRSRRRPCDYLVCESTYGDRDHPHTDLLEELARTVNDSVQRGGVILVAAFAVGRSQQLVYLLQLLAEQGRIAAAPHLYRQPHGRRCHRRLLCT